MNTQSAFLTVVFCGILACAYAQQIATTGDGKKIMLKADGTWKYASQSDLVAARLMSSPGTQSGSQTGAPDILGVNPGRPGGLPGRIDQLPTGTVGMTGAGAAAGGGASSDPATSAYSTSIASVIGGDATCDVRKTRWGMAKKDVKAVETATFSKETPTTLEYRYTIAGLDCGIIYNFESDKLKKVNYAISQDHLDPSMFYADFERLIGYMSKLYGQPAQRDYNWSNEMYKQDKTRWGFAISIGFLACHVIWQSPRTKTDLNISGGAHKFSTAIDYISLVK